MRGGVGCRRSADHTVSVREGEEKSMNTTLALDSADSPLHQRMTAFATITVESKISVSWGLGGLDAAQLPIHQVLLEIGETDFSEDLVIRCAKRP